MRLEPLTRPRHLTKQFLAVQMPVEQPFLELMKQVVEKLDYNDMIALSAYLGSLDP